MSKQLIIKLCSVFLVMVLIFSMTSICSFAENDVKIVESKTTYIDSTYGNIEHGVLKTTVSAKMTASSVATSVKIKMELQKLSSGSYSTVETWEQTFSGKSATMEESKITNPLSTYRLKATFTAYSGSASETKILYVNET